MKRLLLILALCLSACATTGTPAEQFTTNATKATQLVDQVTLAADASVKANALKGADAQNTLTVIKSARDGLNAAKALAITDPTGANSKLAWSIGLLTATQGYLATLGTTK